MKTTIELPDALLDEARAVARQDKTTLRDLVEQGLREVLSRRARSTHFALRDASFGGHGMQPEFRAAEWHDVLNASYGEPQA